MLGDDTNMPFHGLVTEGGAGVASGKAALWATAQHRHFQAIDKLLAAEARGARPNSGKGTSGEAEVPTKVRCVAELETSHGN